MTEKAPVKVGERFVSMRTGKEAKVLETKRHLSGWWAYVILGGDTVTWLTCSKDGINGYRRKG